MRSVIAFDIGGTKMAAAVVASDGTVLSSGRVATPVTDDGELIYRTLVTLGQDVIGYAGHAPAVAGAGCAGPMRYPEGIVSPLNAPGWREFPLKERLSATFHLPCIVDNDAKTVAVGEHWLGAGRGVTDLLGMVVSTGVGGGVIADGRLVHGARGNAGHIGHVVVWSDGPRCVCGARGCVEAIASGAALARRLRWAQDEGRSTDLPYGASAALIADAARAGDALAMELFRQAGEAVGRGIASSAALLDLQLIAIGGSVALKAWDLLGPPLEEELRRSARLFFTRDVRVVQAELGDAAGLLGAAALAFDLLGERRSVAR